MSIFPIASALVTWQRATAYVLDSVTAAGPHSSDRDTVRESPIQVRLQGTPTGTVTVSGTVDGSADSEALTWTGTAGYRVTRKRFTGALTFTLSQTGASTIEAKATGPAGDPQVSLYTVRGPGHPVSLEEVTEGQSPARMQGDQEEQTVRLLVDFEEVWAPRKNDRVTDDLSGHVYEVMRVTRKQGSLYTVYWACKARRLDAKGST